MATDSEQSRISKKERKELKKQEKLESQQKKTRAQRFKRIVGWLLGAAAVIGLIVFFKFAFTPTGENNDPVMTQVAADDWVKGASESANLLVEYADFQCPACAEYYPIVKRLGEERTDVRIAYRHLPLRTIHTNAQLAAQAAEAAGIQEKFWEMHNTLYENQTEWAEQKEPTEQFVLYAESLALDTDQFRADLTSDAVKQKVDSAYDNAVRFGIDSTPTFFLNGKRVQPRNYDGFVDLLE